MHPAAPSAAAAVPSFQTALHDFLDALLAPEDPAAVDNEATSSLLVLLTELNDVMQWTSNKPGAGPRLGRGLLQHSFGIPAVRRIPALSMILIADSSCLILSCVSDLGLRCSISYEFCACRRTRLQMMLALAMP